LSPVSPQTPANTVRNTVNTTLALPGFYCKNKGHLPSYVPFTSVNDGICDYELCCDGSEEFEHVGGVKCPDKCKEIGKEWKRLDEIRQKSLGNAAKKRKELVVEAGRLRKEVEDRIKTLSAEIEGHEHKLQQLEAEYADVERREKGRVIKGSVSPKAGKMGILVGLAKQRMNELRESVIRVRSERDAYDQRIQELEKILSTFKEEYNPNFNDEGVKRAVRAWEDYAARDKTSHNAAADRDLEEMSKSDEHNGLNWEDYENEDGEGETDVRECICYPTLHGINANILPVYEFENYLPPTIRTWLDTKLRDLRLMLIENGILAETSSTNPSESKAVQEAKKRVDSARKDLEKAQKDRTSHQEDLSKDWGVDDVFRALKGQCVSTEAGEYTYEVCFMEKTTQKPKKGGGNTNMGNFVSLEKVFVDEDVAADGRGLGSGERIAMKHDNGQHCWNGPNRSTTVILACSEQNELWKVMEEAKCVYRMEVGTPAVCEALGQNAKAASAGKDEL
jgi:protein kinase C substrate 80K-H